METIISRIKELSIKEGVTISSIEKKIGASKGVLSRAIKNGSDIQAKWLQSIVDNYPDYSSYWLLTGKGNMILNEIISEAKSIECLKCKQKEQRIIDLLEIITSLKEVNAVQKELIVELKNKHI
jgi:hypothetical protein